MPGNTKRRRKKHRGTQTGSIDRRSRSRPRNRDEARARARNQRGGRPDRRDQLPTWRGAAMRGLFFAALLFPISLLFGQAVPAAIVLTVIAAVFYIPLGYYTDLFSYRRRKAKLAAAREAKQSERGKGGGAAKGG